MDSQEAWLFKFCIETVSGEKLERAKAEALMEKILSWAEQNECQIGGGFRVPKEKDFR